jgi:hypothetical protein
MTTSREKTLAQGKTALVSSNAEVPYTVSDGRGRQGHFVARVGRLDFPARYQWGDVVELTARAREGVESGSAQAATWRAEGDSSTATFLYSVHKAMVDAKPKSKRDLVFNGKRYTLETSCEPDPSAGARFAQRKTVSAAGRVMRLDALIIECGAGTKTPFRVWYERGNEQAPPLGFEYQARSFLRLSFEADANVETPPIKFALTSSKEAA